MRTFCNNLRQNDRVYHPASDRQGKVLRTPKNDQNRQTCILFDGTQTGRYVDVMQLRLMDAGKVLEDVPPVDGEPPAEGKTVAAPSAKAPPVVTVLKAEREKNQVEMDGMSARFKFLRESNERLDKAIEVLTAAG